MRMQLMSTATAIGFALIPSLSSAQIVINGDGGNGQMQMTPEMQQQLQSSIQDAFSKAFQEMFNRRATFAEKLNAIDTKTQSVTLALENASNDTIDVEIKASNKPTPLIAGANADSAAAAQQAAGNPLLADDSASKAAADSMPKDIDPSHSLVSWVTDVPKPFMLLPHAKKTITLQVKVPPNTPAGDYAGWVNALSTPRATTKQDDKEVHIQFNDQSGGTAKLADFTRITYKVQ